MAKFDIDDARCALRATILENARWRREKASEFPNDDRNITAAGLLEQIADTVDAIPDGLMRDYASLWNEQIAFKLIEAQSTLLREVGFRTSFDNATKLVELLMDHAADARYDADQE